MRTWIIVGMIPCAPKGAKNSDEAWHSAVRTVLTPLRNLDITCTSLKWNSDDGFNYQCYPLLAASVRDHPEQVIVAQVSYGSCPKCKIPNSVSMGHPTFRPLDYWRDQDVYLELLDEPNINVLHTVGVHPIRNQLCQYPLCNVYRLLQPDELHQLLLGLVKDLLHWLLKYLKGINVKDQFDNWFTSVPQYLGLQRFSESFDEMTNNLWQGKEIWGIIRTLAVDWAPIVDCSKDDGKTAAETASDNMVLGPVRALCESSRIVSQQDHSDRSLTALYDALKWFYKKKGTFLVQKISKSAMANCMNSCQENPISYDNKRFIISMLRWMFRCTPLKWLHETGEGKFRCARTEPDKRQPCGQMLTGRVQTSDWSAKSITWHLSNARCSINDFQYDEQQLLQDLGTKPTCPRSSFAKKRATMITTAEEEVYGAANMTANKSVEFRIHLSDAETKATTWSIADTDRMASHIPRQIHGIYLNE